ncbi:hypothetical protein EKH79_12245 [Dyella dinghuensis]|uniref:Translation elongation factor EFTu/EF1A C-terminal domain-containing protein n=1 Tax=Dyella dinghuensis TaxID=1920169 RepID=A0A3S0WNB0_9GAMM|nr:hypothetical protein [Dyella dinghuensis]RUL63174.1 hypothetical protein EKH79_12245 [Dyella dinghuensis]
MDASKTNRFWHAASVVLGMACIPFVAIWFWHNLAMVHEPLHPVPPDHIIPMQVGRHGNYTAYVTPLQNKLWSPWIIFTGAGVGIAFSIALTLANRGRIRVLARVQMIATKDGGRSEPVVSGYRSISTFHGARGLVSCSSQFELEENRWVYPGDNTEVIVSFMNGTEIADVIQAGRKWTIHERGKLVGYGEVITLLTMETFDASPRGW